MPAITRLNVQQYHDRFASLIKQLITLQHGQVAHLRVFNCACITFINTIRDIISNTLRFHSEIHTDIPYIELSLFSSINSFRELNSETCRVGPRKSFNYVQPICFDINFATGEHTEFYDESSLIKPTLSVKPPADNNPLPDRFDLPYDEELFHAFCTLKSRGLITNPITLRNISLTSLPPWQHHRNIIIIEPDENTIAIL